jgi:folate-binding protein YgfZ
MIRISGEAPARFLQGLVTNDIGRLRDGLVYAALLSPQGKYLADFFILDAEGDVLVDVAEPLADDLIRRLTLYRLRARLSLDRVRMPVSRGTGPVPPGALPDPRHPALGWRLYGQSLPEDGTDWDALRVAHGIPESLCELVPGESYILEHGFARLNGVDFRKGCYVGQEVTARMQHKTDLRKRLVQVSIQGQAPIGTPILADGKEVGVLGTQSGGRALAWLRLDRAEGALSAGDAYLMYDPSLTEW